MDSGYRDAIPYLVDTLRETFSVKNLLCKREESVLQNIAIANKQKQYHRQDSNLQPKG